MSLKVGELATELTLDRTELARGLELSEEGLKRLAQIAGTAGTKTDQAMQTAGKSAQQSSTKVSTLTTELKNTDTAAGRAEQALKRVEVPASAATGAQKLTSELKQTEAQAGQVKQKLGAMTEGIGNRMQSSGEALGGQFGGSFLAGMAPKVASVGTKAGPIGIALGGLAVLGLGAGAALASAIADGMGKQQAVANLQAKLGLSKEQATTVGKAAGDAYTSAFGDSVQQNMDTATAAMKNGLIPRDADKGAIKQMISQLDTVSTVLGAEIPEVAYAAGKAIQTGLAQNATEAFDLFTVAAQSGLDVSGDLLDTVTEYGTQFRKVGISGQDAMGLIKQAMEGGARNTDIAADAVKEFSIRVVDGSELTAQSFADLGLNADEMAVKFAAGGQTARDAFDLVLDKVRAIEDPVLRSQIAVGLFGTQAEDLGAALEAMDLSNAAQQLGNVEGAAQRASDVMGSTSQSAAVSMARNFETAFDTLKVSLAEAFEPQIGGLSEWVATHQGEIIQFFTDLGVVVLETLANVGRFASGSLEFLIAFQESIGEAVGSAVGALGIFSEKIGGIVKYIPGMEDMGKAMETSGRAAQAWDEAMQTNADTLRNTKDGIDSMVAGLDDQAVKLGETGTEAANATKLMSALGDSVYAIPDGKEVVIEHNQPEVVDALEKLGLKITEIPGGKFKIESNTPEAQAILDSFVRQNTNRSIAMWVDLRQRQIGYWQQQGVAPDVAPRMQGPVPVQAEGGVHTRHGGEPFISTGPVLMGERETGGESYIPHAPSKRYRATKLLAQTADEFGFGLVRLADGAVATSSEVARMGGGSVNLSLWESLKRANPSAKLTSAKTDHDADGGFHPKGMAIDVDPSQANADYLWSIKEQLGQIITTIPGRLWYNVNGEGATGSKAVGIYTPGVVSQHADHIHAMALAEIRGATAGAQAQQLEGVGKLTKNSSKQEIARAIIGEGRKRGYSDTQIKAILSTGLQESNLDPNAVGGGGAWRSIYQQDTSYAGRDDPNENIREFYNRLDAKRSSPGASGDIYKDIFWLQQAPGVSSAEGAYAGGRQAYLSEIQSREAEAEALLAEVGPSVSSDGLSAPGTNSMASSGSAQPVYVVNWPEGLGGTSTTPHPSEATTPDSRTPYARAGVAFYESGGMQPEMAGPHDGTRVWNEAHKGESYIPWDPSKRSNALAVLGKTASKFGYQLVPRGAQFFASGGFGGGAGVGGFGGHDPATADKYAYGPNSWADFLALGVGGAFSVASMFAHVPDMIASGNVNLGGILGSGMDTSSTSIPGMDILMTKIEELVKAKQPAIVIEYAEINDPQRLLEAASNSFRRESPMQMPSIQVGGVR